MAQAPKSIPCADFLEFQEYLKSLREVDDKIIYALNTTIPTNSFKGQLDPARKCRDLHVGLQDAYDQRRSAIRSCIMQTAEQVKTLKEKRDHDDKLQANSSFKAEQKKLRLLQQEMNVEDIVRERSLKVFNERCRTYWSPGDSL